MRKVPWSPPDVGQAEKEAAIRILDDGWLAQGKETETFEKEICELIGCKHAVVVNNGTSALIAAMYAHDIAPGDEVLVPTFTFIASINSILAIGAKPVLVDCDLHTFNTTPELMEKYITKKTKAIMPVDVAGMPIDIEAFQAFAKKHNLIIIEDAAEAMGAEYKGKKIGSFGHTAIMSFHMAKIATSVEGGVILTDDAEIARRIKIIRYHGMYGKWQYERFGLNFRITDIQSAIGRVQIQKVDKAITYRNKLVDMYKKELAGLVKFQEVPKFVTRHPYMLFGVLNDPSKRDKIIEFLTANGVETRISWKPAHLQDYHSKLFSGSYPNSEAIGKSIINLPMGNGLSEDDIKYVIDVFKKAVKSVS